MSDIWNVRGEADGWEEQLYPDTTEKEDTTDDVLTTE